MIDKKYILPILLVAQISVLKIVALFPEFIERYYSNGFYLHLSYFLQTIFGVTSLAIGDLLYAVALLLLFRWFLITRKSWKKDWKNMALQIVSGISVLFFLFHLMWATNYHRVPLSEKLQLEPSYTTDELEKLTLQLIAKTNAVHHTITQNDSIKVVVPYTFSEIIAFSHRSYASLSKTLPLLNYHKSGVKASIFRIPLSYMGFGGYLNPFTHEAQVNTCLPFYNLPTTTLHEMAHQFGIASESEANLIGFLASVKSDDPYFQYSGYSFAVKHCLRNLERQAPGKSELFLSLLHSGVRKNFDESHAFQKKYETFLEPLFKIFYDQFLKLNQQKDGLESYSQFVGLLIGMERAAASNAI